MTSNPVQIVHDPDRERWEAVEGERAVGHLSYELVDKVLDLQHTVVDRARREEGLGGRLAEAALQHAREEGLRVRPTCPFLKDYLREHPEHQDLVVGAADG